MPTQHDETFMTRARQRARGLLTYIDHSPTAYHAVDETARRLEAEGFERLSEKDVWNLSPMDRRYVMRNGSTIIAFQVGNTSPAKAGFFMVGAHTDSPNLKLKPHASYESHGYRQLGVEVYGSPLVATWTDRDLSIAGRVAVQEGSSVQMRLFDAKRPLARVPNLAIHLNREVKKDGLKLNAQTHMPPVLSLEIDGAEKDAPDVLTDLICKELSISADQILDHDLALYDVQKGTLSGLNEEFILAGRLDNLASCNSSLTAMLETLGQETAGTKLITFYDHEEVGSRSAQGAAGPFLEGILRRIVEAHSHSNEPQGFDRAIATSFLISADMAHAVHPNYADRHEPHHLPMMGKGPVIKTNAGQSYATDGASAARFIGWCREAGFDPQHFVNRTDLACGGTIGPITAARIGVKTVDVGNPMLSMHSIREMSGTVDVELMHAALVQFFRSA